MVKSLIPEDEFDFSSSLSIDPRGRIFEWKGGLYRGIFAEFVKEVESLLESSIIIGLMMRGDIQHSTITDYYSQSFPLIIAHNRIEYLTLPSEWSSKMFYRLAEFALELITVLSRNHFWIADLHCRNFAFRGTKPVFLDITAIATQITYTPAHCKRLISDFYTVFLHRIMLDKSSLGHLSRMILSHQDSISSSFLPSNKLGAIKQKIIKKLRSFVEASSHPGNTLIQPNRIKSERTPTQTKLLGLTLAALSVRLRLLRSSYRPSAYTSYNQMRSLDTYYFAAKQRSVEQALANLPTTTVLDIGCNTGLFSRIALRCGHTVLAIDRDDACINSLFIEMKEADEPISLAVQSFFRLIESQTRHLQHIPSPLTRWRSKIVLCLAISHHLMRCKGLTYERLFAILSELTEDILIFEMVPPFQQESPGLDQAEKVFSKALNARFEAITSTDLGLGRTLYVLKKLY